MRTVLVATAAFVFHLTEMPPAKPASTVSWQGGFFRYREIYPEGSRRWWLGNAGWREPTSSDRLPSIGVSLQPAIPRRVAPQQSPPPLHRSPTRITQSNPGATLASVNLSLISLSHYRGARHYSDPNSLSLLQRRSFWSFLACDRVFDEHSKIGADDGTLQV